MEGTLGSPRLRLTMLLVLEVVVGARPLLSPRNRAVNRDHRAPDLRNNTKQSQHAVQTTTPFCRLETPPTASIKARMSCLIQAQNSLQRSQYVFMLQAPSNRLDDT